MKTNNFSETFDYTSEERQLAYPMHYWICRQGSEYIERIYDLIQAQVNNEYEFFNRKDEYGYTPIEVFAAFNGYKPETIVNAEYLLKKGADLNSQDKYGNTPLHAWAYLYDELSQGTKHSSIERVAENHVWVFKHSLPFLGWMLANGANVDIRNNSNTTALDLITQVAPKGIKIDERTLIKAYSYWKNTGKVLELEFKKESEKGCCIMM